MKRWVSGLEGALIQCNDIIHVQDDTKISAASTVEGCVEFRVSEVDREKLMRRIDLRMLSMLFIFYVMAFFDK